MPSSETPIQEKFIRFQNRLLSPSFLNDGTHFARILGREDFIFWNHIQEKAPYLPLVSPLGDVVKGQVILERLELESSPRRFADLLQGIYDALAFYSNTPEGETDQHWRQFASWLLAQIPRGGLSTIMPIWWLKEPRVEFTPPPIQEKYYIPGELKIMYTGPNWGEEQSRQFLANGFKSRVLEQIQKSNPIQIDRQIKKYWYEKPAGIILVSVVGTLIAAGLTYWLGWK